MLLLSGCGISQERENYEKKIHALEENLQELEDTIEDYEDTQAIFSIGQDLYFESADACIVSFFNAIERGDTELALSYFGVNHFVESIGVEDEIQRIGALHLRMSAFYKSNNGLGYGYSRVKQYGYKSTYIWNLMMSIQLSEASKDLLFKETVIAVSTNPDEVTEVVEASKLEKLEDIEVEAIYHLIIPERGQVSYDQLAIAHGFDHINEYLAVFSYKGNTYYLGITLHTLDEKYSISSLDTIYYPLTTMGAFF